MNRDQLKERMKTAYYEGEGDWGAPSHAIQDAQAQKKGYRDASHMEQVEAQNAAHASVQAQAHSAAKPFLGQPGAVRGAVSPLYKNTGEAVAAYRQMGANAAPPAPAGAPGLEANMATNPAMQAAPPAPAPAAAPVRSVMSGPGPAPGMTTGPGPAPMGMRTGPGPAPMGQRPPLSMTTGPGPAPRPAAPMAAPAPMARPGGTQIMPAHPTMQMPARMPLAPRGTMMMPKLAYTLEQAKQLPYDRLSEYRLLSKGMGPEELAQHFPGAQHPIDTNPEAPHIGNLMSVRMDQRSLLTNPNTRLRHTPEEHAAAGPLPQAPAPAPAAPPAPVPSPAMAPAPAAHTGNTAPPGALSLPGSNVAGAPREQSWLQKRLGSLGQLHAGPGVTTALAPPAPHVPAPSPLRSAIKMAHDSSSRFTEAFQKLAFDSMTSNNENEFAAGRNNVYPEPADIAALAGTSEAHHGQEPFPDPNMHSEGVWAKSTDNNAAILDRLFNQMDASRSNAKAGIRESFEHGKPGSYTARSKTLWEKTAEVLAR